MNFSRITLYTS